MRDEIVAYIEKRIEELKAEAIEAEKNGRATDARCAITGAIELNQLEIVINNITIRNIQNKINEIIEKREKSA